MDDELNREEKDFVKTAIEISPELKKKYTALLDAHSLLKNVEPDSPNLNFAQLVMNKISTKASTARQQKYFLISILSFFGVIVLGITGYVLYQIISSMQASESTEAITTYSKSIGDYFSNLFGKKNLSIFGSILSFIMLVSGYFLFEFQKQSKKNFGH
jgi:ABC-type siderophore export system fused ATPase/permease subunit